MDMEHPPGTIGRKLQELQAEAFYSEKMGEFERQLRIRLAAVQARLDGRRHLTLVRDDQ